MQFSSIWPIDRTLSGATALGQERTWERWQWRSTLHSPKLQHYWNLNIRLSSVISGTTGKGFFLPLCRGAVGVFYNPSRMSNTYESLPVREKRLINTQTPIYIIKITQLYMYIYIYIYIYIYTNFVEHNRHFLSTYFLVDRFVLPYCFYRIRRE